MSVSAGDVHYILARFSGAAQLEIIVRAPLRMPAAPKPATALPHINITEELATPHKSDPSSKIEKKVRKTH